MRLPRTSLLLFLLIGAAAGPAHAQRLSALPLSLQARVGAALPMGDFADRGPGFEAEPGVAFGIGAALRLLPMLELYGEYRQERFGCGECADADIDGGAVSAGVEGGAQLNLPLGPLRGIGPWVRGGVVYQALELAEAQGGVASERGTGYAVGGGLRLGLMGVAVLPGVHYRSYPAEFHFRDLPARSIDVSHLVADVAVSIAF